MLTMLMTALTMILGAASRPVPAPEHPHVVFMIGEDEYHTWETLPEFAKKELEPRGYRVTIVNEDKADKNNFPGLIDALRSADLLFVSTRRRTPPSDQLNAVRAFLAAGKPIVWAMSVAMLTPTTEWSPGRPLPMSCSSAPSRRTSI